MPLFLQKILGQPHNYEGRQLQECSENMPLSVPPTPSAGGAAQGTGDAVSRFGTSSTPVNDIASHVDGYAASKKMDNERLAAPVQKYLVENVLPTVSIRGFFVHQNGYHTWSKTEPKRAQRFLGFARPRSLGPWLRFAE
jgi:hypothetical protein